MEQEQAQEPVQPTEHTEAAKKRISREQMGLDRIKQYRLDLPGVFEKVKVDLEAQIANI